MTLAIVERNGNGHKPANDLMIPQDRIKLLKDSICKDASDAELEMFVEVCNRRKLDPFAKQIYAIRRQGRLVYQTSIDGFRAIAERTQQLDGQDGPYWCGPDGQWVDVWLQKEAPAAAKITVYRKGASRGFTGVARFGAYAQQNNSLWKTMPDTMLAKCAESLALRKAFPEDLSGLYTADEMMQADNGTGAEAVARPAGRSSLADSLVTAVEEELQGEIVSVEPAPEAPAGGGADGEVEFIRACHARGIDDDGAARVLEIEKKSAAWKRDIASDPSAAWSKLVAKVRAGNYDAFGRKEQA